MTPLVKMKDRRAFLAGQRVVKLQRHEQPLIKSKTTPSALMRTPGLTVKPLTFEGKRAKPQRLRIDPLKPNALMSGHLIS